jgi:DNA-binding CsgD family transcriptional regulator
MESRDQFSERERKVIEALLQGKSNKQIAVALGLSLRTVEFHLSNIYKKLGVASRTEAVIKLSEGHLRESAIETNDALRKLTVEKAGEVIENGENHIQLRRQKMKNIVYLLIFGILLILIIGVSIFGGQISNLFAPGPQIGVMTEPADVAKTPNVPPSEIPTEKPIATSTRPPTATPTLSYQVLSPTKIRKDNVTFEASAVLMSCAELQFEMIGTFPSDYPTQLPPGNEGDYPFIVKPDGVMLSSPNIFITRDLHYGGGGGSDSNDIHVRGEGDGYFINPPLTSGQKMHLTALINFNDLFGITNAVPFEIDLTAGQCQ